ncbi:MAG: glycosyltransferase family 9 protein [Candidatus Dadabacteria bacterium]|nr:MAG: glycosyltransferase family 9 protein [Candidatus Dadabacteria bacterium]
MRLKGKLAIDHWIGGPLAWTLNFCAIVVSFIIRRDHSLSTPPKRVLFLKFVGIGSIVRASFLFPSIRAKFPEAEISFATFPQCKGIVEMYPDIDKVITVRDSSLLSLALDTLKLIVWCWIKRVDLIIDLEVHSKYSSLVVAGSLAKNRAGFGGITSRFRTGLYSHLVFWNPTKFVEEAYEKLGNALGVKRVCRSAKLSIPNDARLEVEAFLKENGFSQENNILIGININSSELRRERKWPIESFSQVIHSLALHPQTAFILVGSPSERDYTLSLLSLCSDLSGRVVSAAGALSFQGFAALLERISLFITNDSGPMHLASVMDVPMVSLWGPTSPEIYCPPTNRHITIYRPIYCSPCTHFSDIPPCNGDNRCLKDIPWQEVSKECHSLLGLKYPLVLAAQSAGEVKSAFTDTVPGHWKREVKKPLTAN